MPSSFWKVCRFTVHMKMGGFSDFYTLRPVFKKVRFQALHFQDPCGQNDAIYVRFRKRASSCGRLLSQMCGFMLEWGLGQLRD